MDKNTLLSGMKIAKTEGQYSHVIVNNVCFSALAKLNPSVPYTAGRSGETPVRIFNIEGTQLLSCRIPATAEKQARTVFAMKTADAKANGAIEANEAVVELSAGLFA